MGEVGLADRGRGQTKSHGTWGRTPDHRRAIRKSRHPHAHVRSRRRMSEVCPRAASLRIGRCDGWRRCRPRTLLAHGPSPERTHVLRPAEGNARQIDGLESGVLSSRLNWHGSARSRYSGGSHKLLNIVETWRQLHPVQQFGQGDHRIQPLQHHAVRVGEDDADWFISDVVARDGVEPSTF